MSREILRQLVSLPFGKFVNVSFSFHTSNGIKREEIGQILSGDADGETFSARGYYSYLGDDGFEYVVSYVADERGFRPKVEKRIYVEYVDESYRGNEENFPNIDEENDKNATTTESALFIPTHVLASLAG